MMTSLSVGGWVDGWVSLVAAADAGAASVSETFLVVVMVGGLCGGVGGQNALTREQTPRQ